MPAPRVIVGVAGGSGSGKTTVVRRIVDSLGSDDVTVLLSDGQGGFRAQWVFLAGDSPRALAAADVNSDGALDLAIANAASVAIALGDGAGGFTAGAAVDCGSDPVAIELADVDGDGAVDLATDWVDAALRAARDEGLAQLSEIAQREAAPIGLTSRECLSYLRDNLYFYLGPREQRGLDLFYRHATALGLAPRGREWQPVESSAA